MKEFSKTNYHYFFFILLFITQIFIFDDYGFIGTEGVTKFVNEIKDKKDNYFFHNINGHAVVIKLQ